jgi:hypothetical protein
MELVQNDAADPITYVGRGYIYQDSEGILSFKLYTHEVRNAPGIFHELTQLIGTPGTLYKEDRYYSLSCLSYQGDNWRTPRLLISITRLNDDVLVSGRLFAISCTRTVQHSTEKQYYHRLHVFDDIDLPFMEFIETVTATERIHSRHRARLSSNRKEFDIRKGDGEIIVEVASQSPFPSNFFMRIIEAMTFVSARQAIFRVLVLGDDKAEEFRLTAPRMQSSTTKMRKPIDTVQLAEPNMFWRLFSTFLEYAINNAPERGWNRCAVHIQNAIDASAKSLDAWAVGLCVAVDGLSQMVAVQEDAGENTKRCKLIEHVKTFLKERGWNESTIGNRALGLLSQLHQLRVKDRLEPLVASGVIDKEFVQAWSRLRHPSAHGTVFDIEAAPKEEVEKLWHEIDTVTTLLYLIVYHLIGYRGFYTDYSKMGWETVQVRVPDQRKDPTP